MSLHQLLNTSVNIAILDVDIAVRRIQTVQMVPCVIIVNRPFQFLILDSAQPQAQARARGRARPGLNSESERR